MSFGPISALGSRSKSSTYLSMRDEDPAKRRGGLKLAPALTLTQSPIFELASILKNPAVPPWRDSPLPAGRGMRWLLRFKVPQKK